MFFVFILIYYLYKKNLKIHDPLNKHYNMVGIIQFEEGKHIFYLHQISSYLAYGREVAADRKIVFEGYYKKYGPKGWRRISF